MPKENQQTIPISKLATGINGLDEILSGGIGEGSVTLIEGGPGTGKTILGLEMLYRSALAGNPAIFVTFEETAEAVRRNALAMGWDLESLEKADRFFLFHAPVEHKAVQSGQFNIQPLLAIIRGQAQRMGARLIMIDALDVLMRIFNDPVQEANELYSLHEWLAENNLTTILTVKKYASAAPHQYEYLGFMADCIILLDMRIEAQIATRRLRVIKYRGSGFGANEYPYVITQGGSVILPISRITLHHQITGCKVSSGVPELDALLDGGYQTASSILITGASGTGKTTLACTFVREMSQKKQKSLYISFEESEQAIVNSMKSPGIELRPAIDSGHLKFMTPMPESMGIEQHLLSIFRTVEEFNPGHLVIDAVSACRRMGGVSAAFTFMMRLVDFCRQKGITTLLMNQVDINDGYSSLSGVGISSIIDTLILLSYVDCGNEILRSVLIVKSRGSRHSNRYHQYEITDRGLKVLKPFDKKARPPLQDVLSPASNSCGSSGTGGQSR